MKNKKKKRASVNKKDGLKCIKIEKGQHRSYARRIICTNLKKNINCNWIEENKKKTESKIQISQNLQTNYFNLSK